jgi:CRISPR system Cascade subunit CasA
LDREEHGDPITAWQELWEQTSLPMDPIQTYLDDWRHRFDLFDSNKPFLQVPDLRTAKDETKSLDLLVPDSIGLFPMRSSVDSLTPSEAARWLIHCHAYDISGIKSGAIGDPRVKGGKGYPIGIGWAGWLGGIVALGDDLRETLLLNLVLDRPRDHRDVPIWEEPQLTAAPRETVVVRGPLALLTWPQRRIRLVREGEQIESALVCNGDPVPYTDLHNVELMSAWRLSDAQKKKLKRPTAVYMPWTFEPGVALWRGLRAVLPLLRTSLGQDAPFLTARTLAWLGELEMADVLPAGQAVRIRVATIAYGSNNSAWEDIGADELAFDIRLASEHSLEAQEIVRIALERAEAATRKVGDFAGNLSLAAGGDRDDAYATGRDSAYAALDPAFRSWLRDFDPSADTEAALTEWTRRARVTCEGLGARLVRAAGPQAWAGRAIVMGRNKERVNLTSGLAEAWFRAGLARELPLPETEKSTRSESEDA